MNNFWKEPLVHFILAGFVLFLLFEFTGKKEGVDEKNIHVTAAQIDLMLNHWVRQLGRPPSQEELQGLIDDHIREEILMQEAYAMGLDKDDIIIRRRLAQKMEFISGDMLTVAEPTEEEIESFYNENKETYKEPGMVSFLQIFFNVDKRTPEEAKRMALNVKKELEERENEAVDITQFGDPTMIRPEFRKLSADLIVREFGESEISEMLLEIPVNQWVGPVTSNFGLHLVYLTERQSDYIPELKEVAYKIKNEMIDERKKELDQKFMAELRKRYIVKVDDEVFEKFNYKEE